MEKKLIRIYVSYGKGDGEKVSDEYVFEDSTENRKELYEEEMRICDDIYDSVDDFVNGKADSLNGGLYGGDWDDPTGKCIVIFEKDELIAEINAERDSEIASVERLFANGIE